MTVVPLLALAVALAASGLAPDPAESPLDGVTWVVEEIDDRTTPSEPPVTLHVANGVISGRSFCRNYRTQRVLHGETIRIAEIAMTLSPCRRGELRHDEERFFSALRVVTTYHRIGNRALLLDADGRVRLRLVIPEESSGPDLSGSHRL